MGRAWSPQRSSSSHWRSIALVDLEHEAARQLQVVSVKLPK
jgi:hypothetical protein